MSDHFSGPRALAGPYCDICDAYAFPSPERPGKLVLAMNVLPRATSNDFFSEAIVCRFRLRPLRPSAGAAGFAVGETEFAIDCVFEPPEDADGGRTQKCRVSTPFGETVAVGVHDESGSEANGLRVYAGLRSDPFFIDFAAAQALLKGRMAFSDPGVLTGGGANVLSHVIEADCEALIRAGGGPLFAVVAETISAGKLPIRLERVGRPEIKNLILIAKNHDPINRDLEIRDLYNLEDPFHIGPDYRNVYRSRFNANLAFFDTIDGKTDWPLAPDGTHPLTELLLADFMIIDLSKPFAEGSFLEIERAMLDGRAHTSCGGRSLNDDVMDTLYTLLINAGKGPRISDHVD